MVGRKVNATPATRILKSRNHAHLEIFFMNLNVVPAISLGTIVRETRLHCVTKEFQVFMLERVLDLLQRGPKNTGGTSPKERLTYMHTHWQDAHRGEDPPPQFNFRVVKSYKSALSRQVAEAVRIQLRGSVLNVKGVYNRSKLTRLVDDEEWDRKVWADAWNDNREIEEIITEDLKGPTKFKKKRREDDKPPSKRIKRDPTQKDCSEVTTFQLPVAKFKEVSGGGSQGVDISNIEEAKQQSTSNFYNNISRGKLCGTVRYARTLSYEIMWSEDTHQLQL